MKNRLCVALGAVLLSVPALGKSPQLVLGGSMGVNTMKGKFKAQVSDTIPGSTFKNVHASGKDSSNSFQGELSTGIRFFPHDSFFVGPDVAIAMLGQSHKKRLNHRVTTDYIIADRVRRNFAFKPGVVVGATVDKVTVGVKVGATLSRFKINLNKETDNFFTHAHKTSTGFAAAVFGEYAFTKNVSGTAAIEIERLRFKKTFSSVDPESADLGFPVEQRLKYRTRGANIKAGVVYKVGA